MRQHICIHDKRKNWNYAIPESGILVSLYNTTFKGYKQTFPEFLDSLKKAPLKTGCCVSLYVDFYRPEFDQLWYTAKEFIGKTNTYMKLFLKLFRVKNGNIFSPLMVEMNFPNDLRTLVLDFSKTTPKYTRDNPTDNSKSDTSDNDDENVIVVTDAERNSKNSTFMTPTSMVYILINNMVDSQVTKGCKK